MVVLTGSAFADNNTKCLEEHPQKRTVYRDEAGVVTCVNYGGKRAVEYSYNKFKNFSLGKQKYSEGALIGKKFHGFESIQTNDVQSPISDGFHGTVLKELFNEVNQVTTLDQLLEKNYPNIKKQNAFVKGVAQEYFTAKAKEVPVEFEEKTLIEKLNFIQNEMYLEQPQTMKDLGIVDLDDAESLRVLQQLFKSDNQKMSISQCNPGVVDFYQKVLMDNMISKKTMENERLFAETNIFEEKIKILLGTFFMENLLDKTIGETKEIMKGVPLNEENETVMMRYNRDGSQEHEFPELSVFSRVLVHELGHVHQFSMLRKPNSPYQLYKIYLNLAARMAKQDQFLNVPEKFKNEIKSQILEPVMGAFEYSAEAYFVDAVPCIL